MFDPLAWLNEAVEFPASIDATADCGPRYLRICYLLFCNGGNLAVRGWGIVGSYSSGHQLGLRQAEAFELLQIVSFTAGLEAAEVDWRTPFQPYWDEYCLDQQPASSAVTTNEWLPIPGANIPS